MGDTVSKLNSLNIAASFELILRYYDVSKRGNNHESTTCRWVT